MNSTISKKVLIKLGVIYGVIMAIINVLGCVLVFTTKLPNIKTPAAMLWENFKTTHVFMLTCSMSLIFFIPILICILYVWNAPEDEVAGRIINLPIMYSFIGGIGWAVPYFFEVGCLLYLALYYKVDMRSVAVYSFFNVIQSALFIGTLAFMSLDAVHRLYVLPKYFPDGKVSEYKGSRKLSVRVLITIFYLSVGLFPVFYLVSVLQNYSMLYEFEVSSIVYYFVVAILTVGVVMLVIFSNYFARPLRKLRKATNKIKSEEFDVEVNIVSSDDLGALADNFNDMARQIEWKNQQIAAIQDSIIRGMAVMVESRDNSTGGHINRTSDCVKIFVDKLKGAGYRSDLEESYWDAVVKAAPMHDLGKIAIDDDILRKPGIYTPAEYDVMKKHAGEGARIVENVLKDVDDEQFRDIAVNVAHYHHEKWNGTGYPSGIRREEIPLEARIMALADVFDALVSIRCYKDSLSFEQAFKIIEESLGTHFDPEIGKVFLKCRPELESLYGV